MKARIKETGEIVDIEDLYDDGTALIVDGGYIRVSKLEFIEGEKVNDKIDWEQRRYEISKDVIAAFMSNSNSNIFGGSTESQAQYAIEYADALIAELQKKQ